MDWAGIIPALEDDHTIEEYATNSGKCWNNYIELSGCQPCVESSLFRHVEWMNRTVLQRLCPPSSILFVLQSKGESARPATVECCTGTKLRIAYLDTKKYEARIITASEILTDPDVWLHCRKRAATSGIRISNSSLVDVRSIVKYGNCLGNKLYEIIEVGQCFELQDIRDPSKMDVCVVESNTGGLVVYSLESSKNAIHLYSSRCFPLNKDEEPAIMLNTYGENSKINDMRRRAKPVPDIVFRDINPKKHKLQKYTPLEVLSVTGKYFLYGYVMEIRDKYYYYIRYYDMFGEREMLCSKNSSNIFPVGYAASIGQELIPPASIVGKEERKAFNWDTFKTTFLNDNYIPNSTVERKGPRLDPMQLVEVFNYDRCEMESALVVGGDKGVVFICASGSDNLRPAPPRILPSNCLELFPCGHASKFNILFRMFPPLKTLPKLNDGEERFELSKFYSSTPQPVFEHILAKLQRPSFLPEFYMKGDMFCPPVYINRLCDCGPLMDREFLMRSPHLVTYGPLPHVVNDIVQTLLGGAGDNAEKRQRLANHISQKNELNGPTQYVKLRMRTSHVSTRVAIPETARELAGWIRHLLMCLHACPHLLALDPRAHCPNQCDRRESQTIDIVALKRKQQQQPPTLVSPKKIVEKSSPVEKIRVKDIKPTKGSTKRQASNGPDSAPAQSNYSICSTALPSSPSISVDPPPSAPLPSPKISAISPTTAAFMARMANHVPIRLTALSNEKYAQKGNTNTKPPTISSEEREKRRASDSTVGGRISMPASWRNSASNEVLTVHDSDDDNSNSNDAPKRMRLLSPSSLPTHNTSAPPTIPVSVSTTPNAAAGFSRLYLPTVSSSSLPTMTPSSSRPSILPLSLPIRKPPHNNLENDDSSQNNKPS